ncbi:hypothetical protein I5T88_10990 [Stenotrophomonas maltophilia]|nr:hypothetical protein [Stenotrophomonas maltophilia]
MTLFAIRSMLPRNLQGGAGMKWWAQTIAWLKCRPWTGITISVICIALIVLRNIYPQIFAMDAVSVGLLVVAVAPWFRSAIKSVELAGIGKIELNDVEAVAKEVEKSDLPSAAEEEGLQAEVDSSMAGNTDGADGKPGDHTEAKDSEPPSDAAIANAILPKISFLKWVKEANENGGWGAASSGKAIADLDIDASLLSTKSWRQLQVDRARDNMLSHLRLLCQIYGIAPLGLSATGMLSRLMASSAITSKQASGISAAIEMINGVLHTPTTPEAMQRSLDVAKEVNESLEVLVRKAEIVRLARDRNAASRGGEGDADN